MSNTLRSTVFFEDGSSVTTERETPGPLVMDAETGEFTYANPNPNLAAIDANGGEPTRANRDRWALDEIAAILRGAASRPATETAALLDEIETAVQWSRRTTL